MVESRIPTYRRIAKPQARRKAIAFWTEMHLPWWSWGFVEWLACKLWGHEPIVDPQYDRRPWCAWCRP